jgi:hypothetical protein
VTILRGNSYQRCRIYPVVAQQGSAYLIVYKELISKLIHNSERRTDDRFLVRRGFLTLSNVMTASSPDLRSLLVM